NSAVQMYRFEHNFEDPSDILDLDEYVEGGIENLGPDGAEYKIEERTEGSDDEARRFLALVSVTPSENEFVYEIAEK
ncbi:MAG: hypothetical protein GX020_07105, partial [Firmicutes bacterium]|nr:hypothetical protein [Bacillota bacterium]